MEQEKAGHGWRDRHQYQCLKCHHVTGEERVGPRYRIMDHFLRQHLSLDQAPFYCRLCLFRSYKWEDLRRHTTSFPRHKLIMREKGLEDSEEFLVKNPNAYVVGPRDVAPVEQKVNGKDTLTLALDTAFPDGLDFLEDMFNTTPATPKNTATPKDITTPKTPRLLTPKPSMNTPSQKTTTVETPQPVLDGLPTIEECRKLKTRSAPSSSSSSASSKSSCSGCREVIADVKHLRKTMDSILRKMERQSATNQQLALSMVNIAGMISAVRAPVTHTTAPATTPATAATAATASPQKEARRVVDRSRHHYSHYPPQRQQEWNRQYRERSPIQRRH